MDSESSSRSFSTEAIWLSSEASSSDESPRALMASASRSNSLMEYQRTSSGLHLSLIAAEMASRAASTADEKQLTPPGTSPFLAASIPDLTSSSRLVLRSAETSSTGTPSICDSFFVSTTSPRSLRRSHILSPTTTGQPASRIWVVR